MSQSDFLFIGFQIHGIIKSRWLCFSIPHREGRLKEVYEQKTALFNSKTSINA
ncbi:hypothetical protein HMPREF9383_1670 [Streptococcus sanguinis SK150]|uniref:Uncharacterized protein n=1 Tax=Streptococcus sanguinis SK150 TaxID=888811 RepID=F0ING6_STRSA|nr:hypothetical protein HMPREF9383_1670 [Streptococcus sanguinis SK150]EGF04980.1 hypothetical protein HMPREF9394_1691 [Streptococcus sanguinis SK1057]